MAKHVKNMDRKQNFAKYGNSMSFWEFLVQTFQGQTNHQWWWHPKVVPTMILCFQKDFFSLIDLGTIKKRNFWKTEKSYGSNFGNIVRTSFVWGMVGLSCSTKSVAGFSLRRWLCISTKSAAGCSWRRGLSIPSVPRVQQGAHRVRGFPSVPRVQRRCCGLGDFNVTKQTD